MGSIEYGVAVLGAPLVVLLGHARCGAMQAAVDVVERGTSYPDSIGRMIEPIIPAVIRARPGRNEDLIDRSVRQNVQQIVKRLRTAETMLRAPQAARRLKIVGAYHDLDDGRVDFFA